MDKAMQGKSILVVEDEQALQEALKLKLTKEGIEVLTASTGEEAIEILKTRRPTLVSLDILLPRMNGLEVLRNIRENPKTYDLPVVVVSVSGGQEKIKQAFSMNIVDYLIKSEYKIEDIVNKLKEMLEKYP
ncbi:MAG: response regulator [Patescibacteria group bacterium]